MSSKAPLDTLEALICEAVKRHGDDWAAVTKDLGLSMSELPNGSAELIHAELHKIIAQGSNSFSPESLH